MAIAGQAVEHWYFHRSMSVILRAFFDHGFALDGFEEPLVDPERGPAGSPGYVYTEIPGVLVVRFRTRKYVFSMNRLSPDAPLGVEPSSTLDARRNRAPGVLRFPPSPTP